MWPLLRGHVTSVGVHPLGVDAPALRERAHAADVQAGADALAELAGDRKIIVRIDRTELSKNILRGLAAYRELLATRPEWHGKVVHIAGQVTANGANGGPDTSCYGGGGG